MMKALLVAIVMMATLSSSVWAAPPPSQWHQNEWVQFIDGTVSLLAGDAPGTVAKAFGGAAGVAAGGLGDVYSALSAVSGATQVGLIGWLRNKIYEAQDKNDYVRENRYQAFLTAIANNDASQLHELQKKHQQALAGATSPPSSSTPGSGTEVTGGSGGNNAQRSRWRTDGGKDVNMEITGSSVTATVKGVPYVGKLDENGWLSISCRVKPEYWNDPELPKAVLEAACRGGCTWKYLLFRESPTQLRGKFFGCHAFWEGEDKFDHQEVFETESSWTLIEDSSTSGVM